MPRPNKGRLLASEANLARRIKFECERRGWKYPELADRMAKEGCPIQVSALYKIHGDPPRRITVDELVALAKVFGLTTDNLLVPVELVEQEWAKELALEFAAATDALDNAVADLVRAGLKTAEVFAASDELGEFLGNQWSAAISPVQWFGEFVDQPSVSGRALSRVGEAVEDLLERVSLLVDEATRIGSSARQEVQ